MNLDVQHHHTQLPLSVVRPVVVVGKIIIDEYQAPQDDKAIISIGGGGPQAAWGAAAALAVMTTPLSLGGKDNQHDQQQQEHPPQPQPVIFFGPVGDLDWTDAEDAALLDLLGSAVQQVCPIRGPSLRTPRIRLWHDEQETIQWKPLYDSFGEEGARQLWNNRPCAMDILNVLLDQALAPALFSPQLMELGVIGHAIMEAGTASPGEGNDAAAFLDADLQQRLHYLGIEPVAFPVEATGRIAATDARTCLHRLQRFGSVLHVISPDDALFHALEESSASNLMLDKPWEFAVRNGPQGSRIYRPAEANDNHHSLSIPAATLETVHGKPVNPTGAGNAYAAAYTTCRGNGLSSFQSASIASAIGAVMCEYHHIPPWNNNVLARIQRAVQNVETKNGAHHVPMSNA